MTTEYRICNTCATSKPLDAYDKYKNAYGVTYHRLMCRECRWAPIKANRKYPTLPASKARPQKQRYFAKLATDPERLASFREKKRLRDQRRNARLYGATATLTEQEWKEIIAYFQSRCAYCLTPLDRISLDHIIPLAQGGSHTADNIVPACIACNSRKCARSLWQLL